MKTNYSAKVVSFFSILLASALVFTSCTKDMPQVPIGENDNTNPQIQVQDTMANREVHTYNMGSIK